MSAKRFLVFGFTFIAFSFLANKSFCQKNTSKINLDSIRSISIYEFNNRVDRAIKLLQETELSAISDTDHINIMMCLNTIFMKRIPGSIEQEFEGGRYGQLEILEKEKNYSRDIIKVYPDYVPNRGMGYYFEKLKMELYGTPHLFAMFNVVK